MLTRGIKHNVDNFINQLQGQYFPLESVKEDGTKRLTAVQLGVRPIQLWEIVMPEPCLPDVMKMIWAKEPNFNWKESMQLNTLRKILGAEQLPKFDWKTIPQRPIFNVDMGLYPIGIKKDKYGKAHEKADYQEFL